MSPPDLGSNATQHGRGVGANGSPITSALGEEARRRRPEGEGQVAGLSMHRRYLCSYVAGLGVPKRMVEEITQDTLLAAIRRQEEFRGESSVRTWLRGIAFHLVLNWRRRRGNHEICDAMDSDGVDNSRTAWGDVPRADAFDTYLFKELCVQVEAVLDAQPEAARRLWRMVVLEDTAMFRASRLLDMKHSQAIVLFAKTNLRIRGALTARQKGRLRR